MGLLGGAISDMQKSYKQNRSLGNKKKSLKERSEHFQGAKQGKKLEFGKMSKEEYAQFKKELSLKKKKDQRKVLVFYSIIGLITISLVFILKSYLGF